MPPRNDILKGAYISWSTKEDDAIGKIKSSKLSDDGFTFVAELDLDSIITFPKEKMMNKNEKLKNVEKIIITRNGNTVNADAYDCSGRFIDVVCHRATAECSPDDIFDFNIGAKLAFDRLYEGYDMTPKPKRKPYNGKIFIRCGKECHVLKSNKIYNVSNGYIINDFGYHVGASSGVNKSYIFEDMDEDELSDVVDINIFYGCHYRGDKDPLRHYTAYFVKE